MPDDTDTIAILFARDPFGLTDPDITKMVEYFQDRRREHKLTGKGMARIEKPNATLEDLGL